MAVDKLVDSTQLDADLTTVANAIRTKGGTSASLAFPAGFAAAIAAIPSGGSGLSYKTGTFTLEEDTKAQNSSPSITHNLGAVPRLVLVWTEAYSQASPPAANLNGGYFMSRDLFSDLKTRLSSSATAGWNIYVPFLITTSQGINEAPPTSTTYWPGSSREPTSTQFFLPYTGGSNYWRAGVTYKYLVLGDWAA